MLKLKCYDIRQMLKQSDRIGIFRGTFDPLHKGHIAFALKAMDLGRLDNVYFLIEPNPRHKRLVTDIETRKKQVEQSLSKYSGLEVIDLGGDYLENDPMLTIRSLFNSSKIVFLMGSDIAKTLPYWQNLKSITSDNEIIIGVRGADDTESINQLMNGLEFKPDQWMVVDSPLPHESSSISRKNLKA